MTDTDKQHRDRIIQQIDEKLQELGTSIQDNKELSVDEKVISVDVLLDTLHFLQDYEENVKVLNDYWQTKRYNTKFKVHNDR